MIPELTIRSFTNDQFVLDKAFYSNFYKIRGSKDNQPVILDIGSHCGYFAFSAAALGAKKVYCFEPFFDNYRSMLKNLSGFEEGKMITYQFGVYTENAVINFSNPTVSKEMFLDFCDIKTEPIEGVPYQPAQCFTLDYILKNFIKDPIDILKINIGYAETEILASSSKLKECVNSVVFESRESEEVLNSFENKMVDSGWKEFLRIKTEENTTLVLMSQGKLKDRFVI